MRYPKTGATLPDTRDSLAGLIRRLRHMRAAGAAAFATALLMCACAQAGPDSGQPGLPPGASQAGTVDAASPDTAAAAGPARPTLEADKARQLAAEQRIAGRLPSAGAMTLARKRALTLRDSGIDGTLMFARDVDFRVTGDIGFMIHRMAASLTPTRGGDPVVFDDPTSTAITVHRGEVTLDNARLTAIFDRYLFQYQGSPLRRMRVEAQQGTLRITGEMQRNGWVPIALCGTLFMRNREELVFHANQIEAGGVPASRLMQAAHVKMADLLKVETPIVRLDGDDVVMQVAKLTPPPALRMTITRIDITPAGARFTLDDGKLRDIAWPVAMPARGLWLDGGDVKFMRAMPMNIAMAIAPTDPGVPFVLDLYHYREQMAAGYFTFDETGALDVRLPSYPTLAGSQSAAARQPAGSASSRYNDGLLRLQQASLAQVREQWRRVPAGFAAQGARQPVTKKVAASPTPSTAVTERRSGGSGPVIHVRNVDFRISGRIGFHVRSLDAQMVPKRPGQPVDLDDPDQYEIRILGGEVVEPWPAMAALFNDYLLDYMPRSLNDLALTPVDGGLRVTGGIKLWNHFPGVWLPATLEGTIAMRDERHLVYTPASVSVLGVPQAGLLKALGVPLASLTPFARKGVALQGNQLVFDQHTVFPPPVLQGRLAGATATAEGLVLRFRREPGAVLARPPANAGSSFIWMEAGDIKMFNALVVNGRTLIRDSAREGAMRFDLYAYRRDVAKGTVRMPEDGSLTVDLAPRGPSSEASRNLLTSRTNATRLPVSNQAPR